MRIGDLGSAAEVQAKLIADNPGVSACHYNLLGCALKKQGLLGEALKAHTQAGVLDRNDPDPQYQIAVIQEEMGNYNYTTATAFSSYKAGAAIGSSKNVLSVRWPSKWCSTHL
jgi:hypothetical protein